MSDVHAIINSGDVSRKVSFRRTGGVYSSFTARVSRDGADSSAVASVVCVVDATDTDLYHFSVNEGTTVSGTNYTEQVIFIVNAGGMTPVEIQVTLVRRLDVNSQDVNQVTLQGLGTKADPWRPA